MLFSSLIRVAPALLLQQVAFLLGSFVQALLNARDQDRLAARLDEILREISRLRDDRAVTAYLEKTRPGLSSALMMLEAGESRLLLDAAPPPTPGRPRRRFLYLASTKYASQDRTGEFAAKLGFVHSSPLI